MEDGIIISESERIESMFRLSVSRMVRGALPTLTPLLQSFGTAKTLLG